MKNQHESSESSADEDDERLRPRYLRHLRSSDRVEVVDITKKVAPDKIEISDVKEQNEEIQKLAHQAGHTVDCNEGKVETVHSASPGVSFNIEDSDLQTLIDKLKSVPLQHPLSKEMFIGLKLINETSVATHEKDSHSTQTKIVSVREKSEIVSEKSEVSLPSVNQEEKSPIKVCRDASSQTTISGDVIPRDTNAMLEVIQAMVNGVRSQESN